MELLDDRDDTGPFNGISQFTEHVALICHIVIVDFLYFRGAFHFVEFHVFIPEILQNIYAAKGPVIRKGGLCNNPRASFYQPVCFINHFTKGSVKRHLNKITKQSHSEIADFITGL